MQRPLRDVPTVNLASVADGEYRDEHIRMLGVAFEDIGFCYVSDHGVSFDDLTELYYRNKQFFDLPVEAKRRYMRPDILYQRGWAPPNVERAAGSRIRDPSESLFFGPELTGKYAYLMRNFLHHYAANIWPHEVPELEAAVSRLYGQMLECGNVLCSGIGKYLKTRSEFFPRLIEHGPHLLRSLHYPAITKNKIGKTGRGGEYTSVNLATLLPPPSSGDLMICRRDGLWIKGSVPPGCMIAHAGDELQYLTGGRFLSARHRVDDSDAESHARMSAAFFIHVRSGAVISLLDSCMRGCLYPDRYRTVRAGDFVTRRLKEVFLNTAQLEHSATPGRERKEL